MNPSDTRAAALAILATGLYAVLVAVLKILPVSDILVLAALLWGVFWLLEKWAPPARAIALHAVTQILVLSWVVHLWTVGYEGRNAIFGGILPWEDAYDYFNDALRLIHGHLMEYAAKRPVFPVTLAALLRLFGDNLRIPLFLFAIFSAWSVALAANEVWKTHGGRAALFLYALVLLSARQWAGFIQTEDIGLPLGLIGFALVWRACAIRADASSGWLLPAAMGIFAVTIALLARAGAFFILPVLILWCALGPSANGKGPGRIACFAAASAAVIAGIAINFAILRLTASGSGFSDYPAIAYGLLHHRDFTFLSDQHPEIAALGAGARAGAAWAIVAGEAFAHPLMALSGLARSLFDLFFSLQGLFGFVWTNPDDIILNDAAAIRAAMAAHGPAGFPLLWLGTFGLYSLLNAIAMLVFAAGFVVAVIVSLILLCRRGGDGFAGLLRYAAAGILLSAPFTPPWITSSHQVQTATLAFLAAMPAIMLFGMTSGERAPAPRRLILAPAGFGTALLLAAIALRAAPVPQPVCRDPGVHILRLIPGTAVIVSPARTFNLRERARGDLLASLPFLKLHALRLTETLRPYLKDGAVFAAAYDACDSRTKFLADDGRVLDLADAGWQSLIAQPLSEPNVMHVTRRIADPRGN